ncbi:hypothetical protein LMG28138_03906 [Pararobbsia alpina]|uniref:Uncharacterized protein n=1 Tax=Pararobbsia alpina TaxID=621374 RepID=A0A6S7BPW8_9BURK|nr:hypothetical protein LMG28138_03906 [Pararobbsia alpina]
MTQKQQHEFDLNRKHTVGQFLRSHSEALRTMKRHAAEHVAAFSLGARARLS